MAVLRKKKKKKKRRYGDRGRSGGGVSSARPSQVEKPAPCAWTCPSSNDIRGWLTLIAQHEKQGLSLEKACDQAFLLELETNPFPAVMGRICPHPCEGPCNRKKKDGSVVIHAVERYLGDWAIERKLAAPLVNDGEQFDEKVAIVGAGPAGLSCAYQLARRGYSVTLFDAAERAGGMLRAIPPYRLPTEVLDAEIQRILDLGVTARFGVTVGEDPSFDDLRRDFDAVYLATGAHLDGKTGLPGEDGPGLYAGTDFLRRIAVGDPPELGDMVLVLGEPTGLAARAIAVESARMARALGAEVTIVHPKTDRQLGAFGKEIVAGSAEGIALESLAKALEILRDEEGRVSGVRAECGKGDAAETKEFAATTVITASAPTADPAVRAYFGDAGFKKDPDGKTSLDRVWATGDNTKVGFSTTSVGQGRLVAESIHLSLRGEEPQKVMKQEKIGPDRIMLEWYPKKDPVELVTLGWDELRTDPTKELALGLNAEQLTEEAGRCFSCGSCFGCENCWMYCTPGCFSKVPEIKPGVYFALDISTCDGCRKCVETCPCGYLDMSEG